MKRRFRWILFFSRLSLPSLFLLFKLQQTNEWTDMAFFLFYSHFCCRRECNYLWIKPMMNLFVWIYFYLGSAKTPLVGTIGYKVVWITHAKYDVWCFFFNDLSHWRTRNFLLFSSTTEFCLQTRKLATGVGNSLKYESGWWNVTRESLARTRFIVANDVTLWNTMCTQRYWDMNDFSFWFFFPF